MDKDLYDLEPSEFYLSQNYPNPFSYNTAIKYCIAYKTKVRLEVFNPEGKMIKVLIDAVKEAGTYEVIWNAANLPGGVYFYKFIVAGFIATKEMVLLR